MEQPQMPFKKGRKFWIEIEATEDGDFTNQANSEIAKLVFKDSKLGQFNITQLILFESYFNKQLADDIKQFLIEKGFG